MTIMATHFALVLGAWRLRVRIDIDEPRESELAADDGERGPAAYDRAASDGPPRIASWGRG